MHCAPSCRTSMHAQLKPHILVRATCSQQDSPTPHHSCTRLLRLPWSSYSAHGKAQSSPRGRPLALQSSM
ncbi:hypothetical protein BDV95DRAFT_580222 [Massariosphaeria phaeospora]|uniref:Uncharacterized protein n=1 Tax=Massariosphaeria phaeospora TaxID=100035 RepID=A0A7C8MFE9_9PLEO|nr:hypothetical protein BDV95DRAFT_580222 [Massariosphaeria phaeospora]